MPRRKDPPFETERGEGKQDVHVFPMSSAVYRRGQGRFPARHAPAHADSCQFPVLRTNSMNHKLKKLRSKAMFTIVGGMIVINPAFAQDQQDSATTLDTVVVSGLRSSLDQRSEERRVGKERGRREASMQ